MQILDKEQFQLWRDNPLTKDFLGLLQERHRTLGEAWARGLPLTAEQQATAVLSGQLGQVSFDHDPERGRFGIFELFDIDRPEDAPQV